MSKKHGKKWDHAYTVAFTLHSNREDASDVTAQDLRNAIHAWVDSITDKGLLTNADAPFDTIEVGT